MTLKHLIGVLCVLFFATAFCGMAADRLPNIVFIFADDLGYGDLGCYGHPYAKTPNLDRLAREGTLFKQFYVTGVTCCPSRTGFMTSQYEARYVRYPSGAGFGDRVTVTELLKKRGYRTGHFGKWHIGPKESEVDGMYGIDTVEVIAHNHEHPEGRDADLFKAASRFIEANKDVPFYVNIWGHITHRPVDPVKGLVEAFGAVKVRRSDFADRMQVKFDECFQMGGNVDVSMRNYLADVAGLDKQVGDVLATLDALGLREKTIVVFSSDHGPAPVKPETKGDPPGPNTGVNISENMLGYAGGFRGGKHEQYEGGVRSPFIVRWPGQVPAGKVNEASVISGMDWLPTLCAIAGAKTGGEVFDGEDVSDIWRGSDRSRVEPLFWRRGKAGAEPSMRDGKWKLHVKRQGGVELYDLEKDRGEYHNVAEGNGAVVKRMRKKLDAWEATLPKKYARDGQGGGGKRKKK